MNIYRFLTFLVLRISCWRSYCGGFSTEMAALFRGCPGVVMALGGIEWEVHLRVSLGPTAPHPTRGDLGVFLWALMKRPSFSTSFYFKGSSPYLLFLLPLLSLGTSPSYQCEISGKLERATCLSPGFSFKCNQLVNPQVTLLSLSDLSWGTCGSEDKTCVLPPDHTHSRNVVFWAWPL